MKIIITGATGLIGAEVVRQAILNNSIEKIFLLVRNSPEEQHPKITIILHSDFSNFTPQKEIFQQADALIWCLGISQTQVNKQQYEDITYGYTDACVRFCQEVHSSIRFVFVSGDGADRTEKSKTLFKRIKGKAENAIIQSGLKDFYIARPDAVNPRHKNKKAPFVYKLAYPFFPLVERFAPHKIIWSDVLAKALLHLAKSGYEKNTLENIDLRALGNKLSK